MTASLILHIYENVGVLQRYIHQMVQLQIQRTVTTSIQCLKFAATTTIISTNTWLDVQWWWKVLPAATIELRASAQYLASSAGLDGIIARRRCAIQCLLLRGPGPGPGLVKAVTMNTLTALSRLLIVSHANKLATRQYNVVVQRKDITASKALPIRYIGQRRRKKYWTTARLFAILALKACFTFEHLVTMDESACIVQQFYRRCQRVTTTLFCAVFINFVCG